MKAELTPVLLSSAVAILMSVLFTYFPWLNTWYAKLDKKLKPLIMLVLLAVVSGAVFGLSCWRLTSGEFGLVTCNEVGLLALIKVFVASVIANQATYLISPVPDSVRKAKANTAG